MTLRLHNTLTGTKDGFEPLQDVHVCMYTCGPTVWNYAHVGNLRAFLFYDLLRRQLQADGYRVTHVMNLTDIDDRILDQAMHAGTTIAEYVKPYVEAFFEDMRTLRALPAHDYPRATEHIPEMVAMIATLLERGFAYEADGDVYFRIESFPRYGMLSHLDRSGLRPGMRVATDKYDKESVSDFALWKKAHPDDEKLGAAWDAPFGRGRPGWHIECSAMAKRYLGDTFDIHGGGVDLMFPHHENEIAQSEAASGQPLARVWLHNGFVTIDAEKMSKSLGNFRTIRDLLVHWDGESLRAFLLSTHYRHPINFSEPALADADRRVEYFYESLAKGDAYLRQKKFSQEGQSLPDALAEFRAAMEDDFNTADALAKLEHLYARLNARIDAKAPPAEVAALLRTVRELSRVLGLSLRAPEEAVRSRRQLAGRAKNIEPSWVQERIAARVAARKAKDFAQADAIRAEVAKSGVELRDSPSGTDWRVLL